LRLKDYGRMAATFFNTVSSRAFRVRTVFEGKVDPEDQTAARAVLYLGDERVVEWREVTVHLRPEELPGKPRRVVTCAVCGERVFDGKDTITAAGPVCQACSRGSYYAL
jgi:formylmethanofuran dehydrogenase subunit E